MTNQLAPVVVGLLRVVRRLQGEAKEAVDAVCAAVDVIAERDKEVVRLQRSNRDLRAQIRAAVSGRTIAAERQALDDDAVESGEAEAA